jgi:hypothetical protein
MPSKRQTAANGKCRAATKAGRQCAAPAVRGDIYCALHNDPDRVAQLTRTIRECLGESFKCKPGLMLRLAIVRGRSVPRHTMRTSQGRLTK